MSGDSGPAMGRARCEGPGCHVSGGPAESYNWDRNGNMVTKGPVLYVWDEDNQLADVGGTSFA